MIPRLDGQLEEETLDEKASQTEAKSVKLKYKQMKLKSM